MDGLNIDNGDSFTIGRDEDGYPAIKIQNTVWVEEPRWLQVSVAGEHDRQCAIDDLIDALCKLRDLPVAG